MSNGLPKHLIGCVGYINALPFAIGLAANPHVTLHRAPPKRLLTHLLRGQLSAALTSSIGAFHSNIQQITGFGISAYKRILSVNLYATQALFLNKSPHIAVTEDSASSLALFHILCKHLWQIPQPKLTPLPPHLLLTLTPEQYDGLLLIGDLALQHRDIPGFITYDLAQEWHALTRLPFVFALVLTSPSQEHQRLSSYLEEALMYDSSHRNETLNIAQKRVCLPLESIQEYYSLCRFRLQEEDYEGLRKFREYYDTLYTE